MWPSCSATLPSSPTTETIIGGQVWQICDLVERYSIPRIVVETNGIGQFAPAVLRLRSKQRRLQCGVAEPSVAQEQADPRGLRRRDLVTDAVGAYRCSRRSVLGSDEDWNPDVKDQADDYLDVGAAAITDTPERIKVRVSDDDKARSITTGDETPACAGRFER